jgi:hypothetical protein
MKYALVAIVIGSIALQAGPATAATCEVAKERAAGKKIARKMACWAKAKDAASPVDAACLAKAEAKFSASFARIEGTCPGDEATVEAAVDSCVDVLVADVPGDGKCAKRSAKAVGKWANRLLGCAARDTTDPGSFSACDAAADTKGTGALAKAGDCASATTHADLHAACVDPVVDAVEPASTTTTATTSTTTTTTVPAPCCDPACDPADSCVIAFMAGSTTCQCVPASSCDLGKCVFQPGAVCDLGGCPPGYACFDHEFCLGVACTEAPGSCGCPASETCFFNVP